MLKGFNPWQRRVAILGVLSLIVGLSGLVGSSYIIVAAGFALALSTFHLLILLGNRQSWRQIRALQRDLEKLTTDDKTRTHQNDQVDVAPMVGPVYEYANRIRRNVAGYEAFALRSKSTKIRDSFALAATNNEHDFDSLTQFVAVQRMRMLPDLRRSDLGDWNHKILLALARLQANQQQTENDVENAVRMYSFATTFFGIKSLGRNDQLINLEALGELERFESQAALAARYNIGKQYPAQLTLMRLNAIQNHTGATSPQWLEELNEFYDRNSLSGVRIHRKTGGKPLDSLQTITPPIEDGPLVSVIVPTFQGGALLLSAICSLLDQSWKNLEIIVVDDGSGPQYQQYLDKAAELSPKIKVVRQTKNLGAYCARNAGTTHATGEYITIHDDDDWSHGDKIALQVQHLMDNPNSVGNMSAHVRASEDLKFLRINNNPTFTQANYSSLMIRKNMLEKIGLWDPVNRGGDAEFRDRLVAYYGKRIEVLDKVPMSFTRTWDGSLTSGEMNRGYVDPARRLYAAAYSQWHDQAGSDPNQLKPSTPRNFPIPSTMEPGKRKTDLGAFDVVFMTDFRFPGGTTSLTLAELRESSKAGYRVGYIHAESPLNGTRPPISQELLDLQLDGVVEQIGLPDSADINLLVIRHPSVVTFMDHATTSLRVNKSILIVNNPPVLVGGTGMVFDLSLCLTNLDRLFHTSSIIIAESGVTKDLCAGLVPQSRMGQDIWPGLINTSSTAHPDFSEAPVLGRHSRDHNLKWPSTKLDFDAAYTSADYETKFLGGADSLVQKFGPDVINGKTVYSFGELEVNDFLDELDFWVYFHDDKLTESFGMSVAEAMAAGKVVILPQYLEASFGEGAIYAKPADTNQIVNEFWNDPSSYGQQAKKARKYVEENFSTGAFLQRIERFSTTSKSI